jgi:hypothetical protein
MLLRHRRVEPIHVAYLSIDPVHQEVATALADKMRVNLYLIEPRDKLPEGPLDAVLYDLDLLPANLGRAVLEEVLAGRSPLLTAVHSYNLEDDLVKRLECKGAVVRRRLGPQLIQALRRAAVYTQEAGTDEAATGGRGSTGNAVGPATA